jgi:hypothetical protein
VRRQLHGLGRVESAFVIADHELWCVGCIDSKERPRLSIGAPRWFTFLT